MLTTGCGVKQLPHQTKVCNKTSQKLYLTLLKSSEFRTTIATGGDYYVASDLYFPHRSPLVRIYDTVQPGSHEGPYDRMGCGISDVDLALFLGDAISREIWKKEM